MLVLAHKGKTASVPLTVDLAALYASAAEAFDLDLEATALKLISKGKTLPADGTAPEALKPGAKLMVVASNRVAAGDEPRSDPTVRGFEREDADTAARCLEVGSEASEWGAPVIGEYRCCRLEPVLWQQFGARTGSSTPHAFAARKLLLKLSTDPGVLRILEERRWRVGTLGEMDPVDDRLAHKTHAQGKCLLGYNTNHGKRIDVRLRKFDLDEGFLPYSKLVETLLHELAHNVVGPHDDHFWHLFAQLKADYLRIHRQLAASGGLVGGRSPLEVAGVAREVADVRGSVLTALEADRQEGPPSQMQVALLDGYLAATAADVSRGGGGGGRTLAAGAAPAAAGSREERRALLAERAAARRDGAGDGDSRSGGAGPGT